MKLDEHNWIRKANIFEFSGKFTRFCDKNSNEIPPNIIPHLKESQKVKKVKEQKKSVNVITSLNSINSCPPFSKT